VIAESRVSRNAVTASAPSSLGEQVFSRTAGAVLIPGNDVRILRDARENYPAWLEAIAHARSWIHFENYIIHDDRVGRTFCDAFIEKARQGVKVRIVYDWIGCVGRASSSMWRRLREAGVEARAYNPPRLDQPLGWVTRDHRKCLALDGELAFVTGLCLGEMWEGAPERNRAAWRDTGIAMRGPAVLDVERAFADSWASLGDPLPATEMRAEDGLEVAGDIAVRVVASKPGGASLYRLDPLIASLARRNLWLTDAYFGGTAPYVQALGAAAQDGVDVRLLVPGPGSDIPVMQTVSRMGYRALLESGVRVFEWNGPMLHAKTAVADGRWARVGSTNLNLQSWIGNRELDLVVENDGFAREMESMFEEDLANSTEIVLRKRRRVGLPEGVTFRRPPRAGGSGTRAAAGALRIGNALGSALSARRVHHDTERMLMIQGALGLVILSLVGFAWPKLLAWPVALICLWFAGALSAQALRRKKEKRKEGDAKDAAPIEVS
jgi:cardiolipin synthase A/B